MRLQSRPLWIEFVVRVPARQTIRASSPQLTNRSIFDFSGRLKGWLADQLVSASNCVCKMCIRIPQTRSRRKNWRMRKDSQKGLINADHRRKCWKQRAAASDDKAHLNNTNTSTFFFVWEAIGADDSQHCFWAQLVENCRREVES